MRHIVTCGLFGSKEVFHIISETVRFSKKKLVYLKCVFRYSLQLLSEKIPILKKWARFVLKKCIGFYIKCIGLYIKCIGLYIKCIGLYIKCIGLYIKCIGLYIKCSGLYIKCIGLYIKCIGLYIKYPLFLSDFNKVWTFSRNIFESNQI